MKRMLDLRMHAGRQLLQLFFNLLQRVREQCLSLGALVGPMPRDRLVAILRALPDALMAGLAGSDRFVAMQQRVRLGRVGDIAGGADHAVNQNGSGIHANMRLHAEMLVVAFLGRVHCRVTRVVFFCRWGRCDQSSVDNGFFVHHQAFFRQMAADRFKNLTRQFVRLQQVAELKQGRRVRSILSTRIEADRRTNRLTVVDRIINNRIGRTKTLLHQVHAQHRCQAGSRATSTHDFRIDQFDRNAQLFPRCHVADLGNESLTSRQLFLGSVFVVEQ